MDKPERPKSSKGRMNRGNEEESFQGSTLAKRKKPKKNQSGISRVDSRAALDATEIDEINPGDMIITP